MAGFAAMRVKTPGVKQPSAVKPLKLSSSCARRNRSTSSVKAQLPDFQLDTVSVAYVGLGSAAVAFLSTFLVLPNFKDQLKEGISWKDIHKQLVKTGVQTIKPTDALDKSKRGAVLLDVRMKGRYDNTAKAPDSVNVPLYQPIEKWDLPSNLRRAGFAFFGVYGTELNDNFLDEVKAQIPLNKEVVVLCDNGGSIQAKVGAPNGFQSRSLKAVYFLRQAGYKKVFHLDGGLSRWFREDLPAEEEPEDGEAFNFAQLVNPFGRKE